MPKRRSNNAAGKGMDWDRFEFEYRLEAGGHQRLLVTIEAYREAAFNLLLPPEWRDRLDRLNRVRAVHGTTAIEGNPLSEEQVAATLDAGEGDRSLRREQVQIRNAGRAQEWVRSRFGAAGGQTPLQPEDVLRMHRLLTEGSDDTDNVPGRLRRNRVVVGTPALGGVHRGAPPEDLPRLMEGFAAFVNSDRLQSEHPVIRALLGHFFLVTIHPFGDGNGRVSRLVEAAILYRGGYNVHGFYGLSNYFYRNGDQYEMRLQECRRSQPFDVTPFVRFGLEGFAAELGGINNFIKTRLNRLVYRSTMEKARQQRAGKRRRVLNEREYRLLEFLLDETEPEDPFSENQSKQIHLSALVNSPYVRSAYRSVTPRTFVRELVRLEELQFIIFRGSQDGAGESTVELDLTAISRY